MLIHSIPWEATMILQSHLLMTRGLQSVLSPVHISHHHQSGASKHVSNGISRSDEPNFCFVRTLTGHAAAVSGVAFQPGSGKVLLSCSADKTVKVWSEDGEELRTLSGHEGGINSVTWSEDGKLFATASDDNTARIWDIEKGQTVSTLKGHTHYVFSARFNPSGNMLVTGSFDETIHIWDPRCYRSIRQIPAHTDPVTSVDLNHDGTLIASSSFDGLVRIWDVPNGNCLKSIIDDDSSPVSFTRFTPNGRFVLIMTLNGRMILKDAETNETKREYRGHVNKELCLVPTISYMAGSSGTRWLISGSEDNCILVWDIQKRRKSKTKQSCIVKASQRIEGKESFEHGHSGVVLCVDAHPCRKQIASAAMNPDSTVRIWENNTDEV